MGDGIRAQVEADVAPGEVLLEADEVRQLADRLGQRDRSGRSIERLESHDAAELLHRLVDRMERLAEDSEELGQLGVRRVLLLHQLDERKNRQLAREMSRHLRS